MKKFIAEKKIPPIPIYVDSPMGVEVSQVLCNYPQEYDEQSKAMVEATGSFPRNRHHLRVEHGAEQKDQYRSRPVRDYRV